jgi:murein DD-endopeptidase MepM/ murein hydrolase activator NlpD
MDKKFRISFYPRDTSRVKVVSFPRRFGILALSAILVAAGLGIALAVAGFLHERPETRELRKKLAVENKALSDRVGKLDDDMRGLRGDLSRLEEQRINTLMMTGVDYLEGEKQKKASTLFSFFPKFSGIETDISASLARAEKIATYFDSTLQLLQRQRALVEGLPTGYPVSTEAILTRGFGYSPDPFTGRKALHAGVDFSLRAGAPVFATGGGNVEGVENDLLWGKRIKINHGRGVTTIYAHLQDVMVKRGQKVMRGETIGAMGMTGVTSGVHLHYELTVHDSKTDPMDYFLPELILTRNPAGTDQAPGT